MRIIAGSARGRAIVAPPGEKTRPTQDHVRESLFNIIRWDVQEARVLDLFAGTGALSLEAISRGAKDAVLIDMDRDACHAIKKNMETSRLGAQCCLIARDYEQAMCAELMDKGLLSDSFLIVVEHKRGMAPLLDLRFEAFDLRKYGDTEITFVRNANREETP